MVVSVTGSRDGEITDAQRWTLGKVLIWDPPTVFLHGGCLGADVQAARFVREYFGDGGSGNFPRPRIVRHPGAFADGRPNPWEAPPEPGVDDDVMPAKTMFARNRDLVAACDVLIALPNYPPPMRDEGGTAYTVARARKAGRRVYIVWPNGEFECY